MRPTPNTDRRTGSILNGFPKRFLERLRGDKAVALSTPDDQTHFSVNEAHVSSLPSQQNAIDLVESWTSAFPPQFGLHAGSVPLYLDGSVTWGIEVLGGVADQRILELGSLEGSHTYMLEQAGARSVLGVEANKKNYLKCLIAKEIFDLKRSRFVLGDFSKYLSSSTEIFDVIWAAGVLYHMEDPVELIRLISEHTEKLYMYTHYIDDEALEKEWTNKIVERRVIVRGAREYEYFYRLYGGVEKTTIFTGGVYSGSVWMRKHAIMDALDAYGFTKIVVQVDVPHHPNGPAMVLAAMKA